MINQGDLIREDAFIDEGIDQIYRQVQRTIARLHLLNESAARKLITDFDIALAYSVTGGVGMTEESIRRGQLLTEGFFADKLKGAFKWAMGASWQGLKVLAKLAGKVLVGVDKVITAALSIIPGGEKAYEMIKGFGSSIIDKAKELVASGVEKFSEWFKDQKDKILTAVLEQAVDPQIIEVVKNYLGIGKEKEKKNESVMRRRSRFLLTEGEMDDDAKEFLKKFVENPSSAIGELLSGGRESLGKVAKWLIQLVFKFKPKVKKGLQSFIMKSDFMSSKGGVLMVRLTYLLGSDLGDDTEEVIERGAKVWDAITNISGEKLSLAHSGREFIDPDKFPELINSLISGSSALENILRASIALDPESIENLLQAALKHINTAIGAVLSKSAAKICKSVGIDPEGELGKSIISAISQMFSLEGSTTQKDSQGNTQLTSTRIQAAGKSRNGRRLNEELLARFIREIVIEAYSNRNVTHIHDKHALRL